MTIESVSQKPPRDKAEFQSQTLPHSFREALYETIHNAGKPAREIAAEIGLSYSQLCNSCNPNLPFKFSSRHLIPLMHHAGPEIILRYITHEFNYSLIKIPEKAPKHIFTDSLHVSDGWGVLGKILHSYFVSDISSRAKILNTIIQQCDFLLDSVAQLRATTKLMIETKKEA